MEIDYDYLRTGTAIGFRASYELCSNYLSQKRSSLQDLEISTLVVLAGDETILRRS